MFNQKLSFLCLPLCVSLSTLTKFRRIYRRRRVRGGNRCCISLSLSDLARTRYIERQRKRITWGWKRDARQNWVGVGGWKTGIKFIFLLLSFFFPGLFCFSFLHWVRFAEIARWNYTVRRNANCVLLRQLFWKNFDYLIYRSRISCTDVLLLIGSWWVFLYRVFLFSCWPFFFVFYVM